MMSEIEKKDYAIEELKQVLKSYNEELNNEGSEAVDPIAAKFMLYCNANSSSIYPTEKGHSEYAKRLFHCISKLERLTPSELTNIDSLDRLPILPTKSVSLSVRVQHTISELIERLELISLFKLRLTLREARRIQGDIHYDSKGEHKLMHTSLVQMRSAVKHQLLHELPALIDTCYIAKYGSCGSFTYSLTEIKSFPVRAEFINACKEYFISNGMINSSSYLTNEDLSKYVSSMWYLYSNNPDRDSKKIPPFYEKICKTICARFGKFHKFGSKDISLKYRELSHAFRQKSGISETDLNKECSSEIKKYFNETTSLQTLSSILGYGSELSLMDDLKKDSVEKSNKKDMQIFINKILISNLSRFYKNVPVKLPSSLDEAVAKYAFDLQSYQQYLLRLCNYCLLLDVNMDLVYCDQNGNPKQELTMSLNQIFDRLPRHQEGGIQYVMCNPRIMTSIYSFISITDQLSHVTAGAVIPTRRHLPENIQSALLTCMDMSKVSPKYGDSSDNAIVFSQELSRGTAYQGVTDGVHTGYLQSATMTITSAVSKRGESHSHEQHDQLVAHIGNELDMLTSLYTLKYKGFIDEHKKNLAKAKATKDTGGVASLMYPVASGRSGASPLASQTSNIFNQDLPAVNVDVPSLQVPSSPNAQGLPAVTGLNSVKYFTEPMPAPKSSGSSSGKQEKGQSVFAAPPSLTGGVTGLGSGRQGEGPSLFGLPTTVPGSGSPSPR